MIAEVYPLSRMPKHLGFFDYRIPKEIQVSIGDIVHIKFKKRDMLGVVRATKQKSTFKRLSSLEKVWIPNLLNQQDVQRYELIAKAIKQSPSTIMATALRGLKEKLDTSESVLQTKSTKSISVTQKRATEIKEILHFIKLHAAVSIASSLNTDFIISNILAQHSEEQVLIIAPRTELVQHFSNLLQSDHAIIDGKTKLKDRNAIIQGWKNGKIQTLIGTRQASLLPANNLRTIIVLDTGSDDYARLDRNPRIDTRSAVKALASQTGARQVFLGSLPRCEEAFSIPKSLLFQSIEITIANLKAQEEFSGAPLLTQTLIDEIGLTLSKGRSVLLTYNKKGVAEILMCRDCKHIPFCGNCGETPTVRRDDLKCANCGVEMWAPKTCPNCGSKKLSEKGIGNLRIKQVLEEAFPQKRICIIDKQHPEFKKADIYLVTEYFFKSILKPFHALEIGLAAELCFDLQLISPDFRANEYAAYRVHRLALLAQEKGARTIIQTFAPDLVRRMKNGKTFLKNELTIRKKYGLPPVKTEEIQLDKTPNFTYKEPQVIVDSDNYEDA